MSADGKPRAANGPGPGVRSMSPTVMSRATTGDVKMLEQTAVITSVIGKPGASGKGLFINVQRHSENGLHPKRTEGGAASSGTPAGDTARVGWRSSVSMASQKIILVGAGDSTDPALAASSHSLWRSITKSEYPLRNILSEDSFFSTTPHECCKVKCCSRCMVVDALLGR